MGRISMQDGLLITTHSFINCNFLFSLMKNTMTYQSSSVKKGHLWRDTFNGASIRVFYGSVLLSSLKGSDGACAMQPNALYRCRAERPQLALVTVKGQEKAGWEGTWMPDNIAKNASPSAQNFQTHLQGWKDFSLGFCLGKHGMGFVTPGTTFLVKPSQSLSLVLD